MLAVLKMYSDRIQRPWNTHSLWRQFITISTVPNYARSTINVAVPGRNRTLFRCVFRSHCCVRSALAVKGGTHTRWVNSSILATFTQRIWPPPLTEVLHYSASNAATRSNYAMFDFYPGMPQICYMCIITKKKCALKTVCIKNPSTVNMVEIDLSPPKIT